jgi:hypothetical protein
MQTAGNTKTRSLRTLEEVEFELELKLLAFELVERRVELLLSVAMTIVAAICALRGSVWTVPAGAGLAAVGFRALADANHRRRGAAAGRDRGRS